MRIPSTYPFSGVRRGWGRRIPENPKLRLATNMSAVADEFGFSGVEKDEKLGGVMGGNRSPKP